MQRHQSAIELATCSAEFVQALTRTLASAISTCAANRERRHRENLPLPPRGAPNDAAPDLRPEGNAVGVLINNVGVSYPYARFLHEVDEKLVSDLIRVNVEGTTKVTKAVLKGMVERKRGAIVNIGSGAAIVIPADPLYSVYAASKAVVYRDLLDGVLAKPNNSSNQQDTVGVVPRFRHATSFHFEEHDFTLFEDFGEESEGLHIVEEYVKSH